jgi:hypothetical protein
MAVLPAGGGGTYDGVPDTCTLLDIDSVMGAIGDGASESSWNYGGMSWSMSRC